MFSRTISNTVKQIMRSGWVAWASIGVMTLAFLVASVFAGLAYVSNLYIQYVETKPSMYVFFDTTVPEKRILELKTQFEKVEKIQRVEYTSWEQAVIDYREYTARTQSEITGAIKDNSLPASIDIRLLSLDDSDRVFDEINPTVKSVNEEFGGTDLEKKVWIAQDKEKVDDLRQVFSTLRTIGLVIFVLFMVIVFLFTLITVEFRTYNRAEEIGVMQLVGGSLSFIRLPYILEGAFYGFMGAVLSTLIILLCGVTIFVWQRDSEFTQYILRFIARLPWPTIGAEIVAAVVALKLFLASLIGGLSSMIAIRRYIK
jgi:cell division transport system permease protein